MCLIGVGLGHVRYLFGIGSYGIQAWDCVIWDIGLGLGYMGHDFGIGSFWIGSIYLSFQVITGPYAPYYVVFQRDGTRVDQTYFAIYKSRAADAILETKFQDLFCQRWLAYSVVY